ncbi:MAG: peptide chain release factor N(5)-glutamine methyltransferase [Gammaproteobacteria bacterium]|nr:peptide chain release factor N(5)-glutamine methyltransferase [Gammaproteobacteria bacterium]
MSEQIDTALAHAASRIEPLSETPRLDAELLLAFCLGKTRAYLYTWPEQELEENTLAHFLSLVDERCKPTPVAYLLGWREFYAREFRATPAALVPRPETELLVEQALARLDPARRYGVLDLGTGSGIVAITLKLERPGIRVVATDIDPGSLELARDNARLLGAEVEFIESDWYTQLPADQTFDLVVSNPPYVAAEHPFLRAGDLPAEPQHALTPGSSGLEAIATIVAQAPRFLEPGGEIVLEHGYDQQAAVRDLLAASGFIDIECHLDLNDLPRCTTAKLFEK